MKFKLKKLCAALMSGILAIGTFTGAIPLSGRNMLSIIVEAASTRRRPCGPENPMLIVHIDTWNVADPAKIIALIPEDIKPYCVFNISLSLTGATRKRNGSWCRTDMNVLNHG